MLTRTTRSPVLFAAVLLSTLAGCSTGAAGSTRTDDGRLKVVTAFYPLQFISERIGGPAVEVDNLTKPGIEPHDLELRPRQVGAISSAGLVVYLKGFQPDVDKTVAQQATGHAFDAAVPVAPLLDAGPHAEQEGGAKDPHVWLDPTRLATIGDQLAGRLGQADPAHAADFTERARSLRADLQKLDAEYATRLGDCRRHEIVTSHRAFAYLAQRYHLQQVGITGLDPESEPTARQLDAVATDARAHGTTTIFFETLVSPKIAETIAREIGAKTAVLDPLEGLSDGSGDYLSVMRTNLNTLTTALDCA